MLPLDLLLTAPVAVVFFELTRMKALWLLYKVVTWIGTLWPL